MLPVAIFRHPHGLLLEREGCWGEIAPLRGRSRESLREAEEQLLRLLQGSEERLLPSVEFGLASLEEGGDLSWPAATLFMGTIDAIYAQAESAKAFRVAKIKVSPFSVQETIELVRALPFHLRLDFNGEWTEGRVRQLCAQIDPQKIDFLEDAGCEMPGFLSAGDVGTGTLTVWKPTVQGIPKGDVVLSSAFESGVGIAAIARLARRLQVKRPIGIGTYQHIPHDLLESPLTFSDGCVHVKGAVPRKELLVQVC